MSIDVLALSDSTDVPKSHCPNCGHLLEAASVETGHALPKPGDISLCLYCAELLTFNADMTQRRPTDDELQAYRRQPGLMDKIRAYQERFRAHHGNAAAFDLRPKRKAQ